MMQVADQSRLLAYLDLPADYIPSPANDPLEFLKGFLLQLPPELLQLFDTVLRPEQRSKLPAVRNRRLAFLRSDPEVFRLAATKRQWPQFYVSHVSERSGTQAGLEEKAWVEGEFLNGEKMHVGKLGNLLRDFEEERAFERARTTRTQQLQSEDKFEEEFDSDDDDQDGTEASRLPQLSSKTHRPLPPGMDNLRQDEQTESLRFIHERFMDGFLENAPYAEVDWNDEWDTNNDMQERWFDDD